MKLVDLRRDTVTRPSPGMREAMARAEVGDDVFGDDPTVNRLAEKAGGAAVLGSTQPQAIVTRPDGTLDLKEVEAAIKPDDPHFARTRLLALENTIGGPAPRRAHPQMAPPARPAPA